MHCKPVQGNTKSLKAKSAADLAKRTAERNLKTQKITQYIQSETGFAGFGIDKIIPEWKELQNEKNIIYDLQNKLISNIALLDNPANQ